jgi:hypothetical protein
MLKQFFKTEITVSSGYNRFFSTFAIISVAEPHHFYASPGKNCDAAPPARAPTLLYGKPRFLKGIKVNISVGLTFFFLLILCNENCCKKA